MHQGRSIITAWLVVAMFGCKKADQPAVASSKPAPKTEAPKTEAPKTEAPKTEAPKTEAPKTEAPEAETPKTEAPVAPAKPAGSPEAKLAAGETLAEMGDGITTSPNPLVWNTVGDPVALATIVKGDHAVLRAYFGGHELDLTDPIDATADMTYFLTVHGPRSAQFRARALVARVTGVGPLFAYHDFFISWDKAGQKPMVDTKWDCDETIAKGGECEDPEWIDPGAADEEPDPDDVAAEEENFDREDCCCAEPPDDSVKGSRTSYEITTERSCEMGYEGECVAMSRCKRKRADHVQP